MFTTTILLAEKVIRIHSLYSNIGRLCKDYLVKSEEVDFEITITKGDIERESVPSEQHSEGYLETLAIYRKICDRMLEYDTILMHGSVVAIGNNAYMFTAPSGTGKTTHSRLWVENIPGAYILNGDKPLLRIADDGVIVYGTPFMGKERYGVNRSAKLKAICILERGEVNSIAQVRMADVLTHLLHQANLSTNIRVIQLIQKLANTERFFKLICNMGPEAAVMCYKEVTAMDSLP